jgi:multisubunit Na+/H+ antiporter MnhF subunit
MIDSAVTLALTVMVVLVAACAYRVFRGPEPADRLQAMEAMNTVLIGVIVILALYKKSALFIDVGVALAAFSFIATQAIARYISEGRVF